MTTRNTENRSHEQTSHAGRTTGAGAQSSQGTQGQQTGQTTRSDQQRQMQTSREPERGGAMTRRNQGAMSRGTSATPITFMRQFMEDVDDLFSQFGLAPAMGSGMQGAGQGLQNIWMPEIDVFQRGNDLVIRADLPGVKRNDIDVELEDGNLIIQGQRQQESENDEEQGYYQSERSFGSFFRSIPLPEGVNPDQVQASFDNGVLEVDVPMPQQQQNRGKKVQVR